MRCDIISIFPEYLEPLNLSLPGQAQRKGLLDINVHDLRDFAHDRHRTVDDTPYGGGAGMVMKPQPWWEALEHVRGLHAGTPTLIVPGPGGEVLNQKLARELAEEDWLIFACGRYEGIDERVYEAAASIMPVRVISLGDYVLNGGEVAVLAMIEASARLLPGFMGNAESLVEESHEDGLLEYPVYTKPAAWQGQEVPEVLLSGDHGKIAAWRHQQRLERTAERRPDLLHPSALAGSGELEITAAQPSDHGEMLTLRRACDVPGAEFTHIARSGGRLVGAFFAAHTDDVWVIRDIAIVPDLWGQGVGRALLESAEHLRPPACKKIHVLLDTDLDDATSQRVIRGVKKAKYRPSGPNLWEKRPR